MKPLKLIRRFVLLIVVLVVLAIAASFILIDHLAKAGIQGGGTYALGVDTNVKAVSLSLIRGSMSMDTLNIANPAGYASDKQLMKSGKFSLEVLPASVMSDTIEIPKLELDGLDVNIESRNGSTNVSAIMENLKKFSGPEDKNAKKGKAVKIGHVVIRNVVAHIQTGLLPMPLTINVPTIELRNIQSGGKNSTGVGEIMGQLTTAIMSSIVEKGAGIIPADLSNLLNRDILAGVNGMGGNAVAAMSQLGTQTGKTLKELSQKSPEALKQLGSQTDKTVKAAADATAGFLKNAPKPDLSPSIKNLLAPKTPSSAPAKP